MMSRLAGLLLATTWASPAHTATAGTPPPKVLYVAQQSIGGDALDPARINSILVANVLENIMEPMLQYDYLARPLQLVPNTLVSMPEVSEGGRIRFASAGMLLFEDFASQLNGGLTSG